MVAKSAATRILRSIDGAAIKAVVYRNLIHVWIGVGILPTVNKGPIRPEPEVVSGPDGSWSLQLVLDYYRDAEVGSLATNPTRSLNA